MTDRELSTLPLVATQWGAYRVETDARRVVQLHPFELDPHPSPIGRSMAGTLNDACRISQPMVRSGWLRHGPRSGDNQRGSEPFVPVPWDTALDLAAQVIADVKQKHGNEAIFAGSYGWSSTGRFHLGQGHLQRFFNLYGAGLGRTRATAQYCRKMAS